MEIYFRSIILNVTVYVLYIWDHTVQIDISTKLNKLILKLRSDDIGYFISVATKSTHVRSW